MNFFRTLIFGAVVLLVGWLLWQMAGFGYSVEEENCHRKAQLMNAADWKFDFTGCFVQTKDGKWALIR